MLMAALLGYGWPGAAGLLLVIVTLLLLVFAVTALSLGLAFALPGHIELLAVIFVANLPLCLPALPGTAELHAPLVGLACSAESPYLRN